MQVEHGWSGELDNGRWAKFKITLDEEDLRRLIGPDLRARVDTTEAYQVLEIEAERLVMAKLVTRYGFDPVEGKQIISTLTDQRAAVIRRIASATP